MDSFKSKGGGEMQIGSNMTQGDSLPSAVDLKETLSQYQVSDLGRSSWQVVNSVVPYIGIWYLMNRSLAISVWFTIPLAFLASGFLTRTFIIFHDCGHGSFFKSSRANAILGCLMGLFTFVPFYHWRWEHAMHHAGAGDLNRRGAGDVWTLTVDEYLQASRWKRFAYRLIRNPFVLLTFVPLILFLALQRFPSPGAKRRERLSVYWTNVALLGLVLLMGSLMGFRQFLLIQFLVMLITSTAGVWLFYVQHQFEGVYWERGRDWDFFTAGLKGSSYYKLPKMLQWFTGNIGFHHIHHLRPLIPNYLLEKCHNANPLFQSVRPITLRSSLRSFRLHLWDEASERLVGFDHIAVLRKARQ
jgi:omega-6 fatty acid desaturase (delta-12 desaturase)